MTKEFIFRNFVSWFRAFEWVFSILMNEWIFFKEYISEIEWMQENGRWCNSLQNVSLKYFKLVKKLNILQSHSKIYRFSELWHRIEFWMLHEIMVVSNKSKFILIFQSYTVIPQSICIPKKEWNCVIDTLR